MSLSFLDLSQSKLERWSLSPPATAWSAGVSARGARGTSMNPDGLSLAEAASSRIVPRLVQTEAPITPTPGLMSHAGQTFARSLHRELNAPIAAARTRT